MGVRVCLALVRHKFETIQQSPLFISRSLSPNRNDLVAKFVFVFARHCLDVYHYISIRACRWIQLHCVLVCANCWLLIMISDFCTTILQYSIVMNAAPFEPFDPNFCRFVGSSAYSFTSTPFFHIYLYRFFCRTNTYTRTRTRTSIHHDATLQIKDGIVR